MISHQSNIVRSGHEISRHFMLVFSRSLWILSFICITCSTDKCMPGCSSKWSNPSYIQKPRDRLYVSMVLHTNGWLSLVKFSSLKCKQFSRILIKSDTSPQRLTEVPGTSLVSLRQDGKGRTNPPWFVLNFSVPMCHTQSLRHVWCHPLKEKTVLPCSLI